MKLARIALTPPIVAISAATCSRLAHTALCVLCGCFASLLQAGEVPSDYVRLAYLDSPDGTCWVDTGYAPTAGHRIEFEMMPLSAAAYGTFMHAQFETLIINRRYNFDNVPGVLLAYMEQNNLPEKFYGDSLTKIRKDVCAFAQFVKDYNVRPLAVEIALVHPDYHYAGMVDLPCVMTDPKTGETFPAIVDFKSGRKGFYEEHEIQLHLYKDMWNVNFPALPVSRVFNFSPKDWRGVKPTYNLKEQTDSPNAAKIPALLTLAAIEDNKMDNTFTVIAGEMSLDDYNPKACITSLSLADLIKTKATKDDAPETAGFVPEQAENVPNNGISVPKQAENVPNDADNVPDWLATDAEKAEKAEKQAKRGRKASKPINPTPEPEKPVKTDFSQKLLNDEIEL